MDQVTRSITVKGDPARLYEMWASFESFPVIMPDVKSVTKLDARRSRWVVKGPLGHDAAWEAETTTAEPGKRLAWNTVGGEVKTSGQVVFADLGDGQTSVTVTMNWTPPAGKAGEAVAKAFRDPEDMLERGLRAFKEHAERVVGAGTR